MVKDVVNGLWTGLVDYNYNTFVGSWRLATASLDIYTFASVFNNILWFILFICMFGGVSAKRFFLFDPFKELIKRVKDARQTTKKEKFLDSLAAGSAVWSTSSRTDNEDIHVNVGDFRVPDLLTPLIPKTEDGTTELVTVTINLKKFGLSESGNEKLKEVNGALKQLSGGEDRVFNWLGKGSTLQGKVGLRESILDELENVYKLAVDVDANCTLQIDNWGILKKGKRQLNVWNDSEVPEIFHAEYAGGILTIAGRNLAGAEVRAANNQMRIKLEGKLHKDKVYEIKSGTIFSRNGRKGLNLRLETWIYPLRLSTHEIEDVVVFASKNVEVEEQSVVIHSPAIRVNDVLWNTVFGRWMVQILLLIVIIAQLVWGLSIFMSWIAEIGGIFVALIWGLLISANLVPALFRRLAASSSAAPDIVRAMWTLYFEARDLIGREPRLSTGLGSLGLPRSFRPSPVPVPASRSTPSVGPSTSSSSSASTLSFVQSILEEDKKASKNTSISDGWEPCIVENVRDLTGKSSLRKVERDVSVFDAENNPFYVTYKKGENRPWPDEVKVHVASQHLVKILQKHLPDRGDLFCIEKPEVPGRDLFTVVDLLSVEGAGIEEDQLGKAQLHVDLLVKYIRKEYKDVFLRHQRMTKERLVSHDMLWAFLYPRQRVVYKCTHTQALLYGIVAESLHYRPDDRQRGSVMPDRHQVEVTIEAWDYNGRQYKKCKIFRDIQHFDGECSFENLPVCPINLMSPPQEVLETEFLANGRRFYELAMKQSHRFMNYQGAIFQPQRRSKLDRTSPKASKEIADGRVMIDTLRFFQNNPGFKMSDSPPPKPAGRIHMSPPRPVPPPDMFDDYKSEAPVEEVIVPDETLMFAPAIVHGFSFTLKQWGLFQLSGFSEVVFDDNSFNELVMDSEDKDLIYSLVSQCVADPVQESSRIDPISTKGQGCIILCYGPPGTGKTLTAESVAENLRRPLWALSLSQIGTTSEDLESSLSRVLNIASMWQAVLLLDEADIFLEKRSNSMDLERNAMIGVVLRQLEYYPGIMFLTTNRVSAFDEAVRSRVSMFVCYRQLSLANREQVWKNLLARAGIQDAPVEELNSIDFNGREIRNVIHTAQLCAKSKNEPLQLEHVKYVAKVFTRSLRTLADTVDEALLP